MVIVADAGLMDEKIKYLIIKKRSFPYCHSTYQKINQNNEKMGNRTLGMANYRC